MIGFERLLTGSHSWRLVTMMPALGLSLSFSMGWGCAGSHAQRGPGAGEASLEGKEARPGLPDFELYTLSGDSVALSDHLGKEVIFLDFWATYCDPCLRAMPHLNKLYEKYSGRGFVVLGVNVDGPDSVGRVRSEVRKTGATFPILLDPETEAFSLYNPKATAPFSLLIDRQGNILQKKDGFLPTDVPELEALIEGAVSD